MDERTTFYAEWLALPKPQFRILVMLAETGGFRGSLTDICRYFSTDPQTSNRNQHRTAVDELKRQEFITAARTGRTYQLAVVPKENEITMPAAFASSIRRHEYNTQGVAWEIVLKVLLWLIQNGDQQFTNDEIGRDIGGVSASQISAAKNVLEQEYQAFTKQYVYAATGADFFRRKGQTVEMNAWWTNP